jgi:hypothetical protein
VNKRLVLVPLAFMLVAPTGCASSRGSSGGAWMAGMMGVMVVGGIILGRGVMHGGMRSMHDSQPAFTERFSPERLLEQRALLELSDEQVAALEALRDDVAAERRTADDAARAAYEVLRPVQRAAVAPPGQAAGRHH